MMKHVFTILIGLCIACTTASLAFAHGTGVSYEENKDGYLIDIGHDEFIAAKESVRFDFTIYPEDIESIEGEVFTDVWVTITKENKIFFASGIHKPVFGTTGLTFVFPEEGTYTLSARFQNEGETVVETEFPLEVIPPLPGDQEGINPLIIYGLLTVAGLCIGFAVALFIPRRKQVS